MVENYFVGACSRIDDDEDDMMVIMVIMLMTILMMLLCVMMTRMTFLKMLILVGMRVFNGDGRSVTALSLSLSLTSQGDQGQKVFTKYKEIAVNFTVVTLLDFNDGIQSRYHDRLDFALASDALQLVTSSYAMLEATASAANKDLSDESVRFQLNRAIMNVRFSVCGVFNFIQLTLVSSCIHSLVFFFNGSVMVVFVRVFFPRFFLFH